MWNFAIYRFRPDGTSSKSWHRTQIETVDEALDLVTMHTRVIHPFTIARIEIWYSPDHDNDADEQARLRASRLSPINDPPAAVTIHHRSCGCWGAQICKVCHPEIVQLWKQVSHPPTDKKGDES